jgi:hypothetical protein
VTKKRSFTYLVKVVISIAFFWVLSSYVRRNELAAMLDRIDWFYFVLSFLLMPVMLSVSCFKWKLLLDARESNIPFLTLIRIYLVGYFFSNLLPSNVGGDVVRSYYAGRLINSQSYSAVCVFVERFSGILLLILLVIFAPLFRAHLYSSPYVFVPVLLAVVLLFIIAWVWRVQDPLKLPKTIMNKFFTGLKKMAEISGLKLVTHAVLSCEGMANLLFCKLIRFHEELIRAVAVILHDRILLAKLIAITILFYFLTWVNIYIAFLAFGVHVDFLGICSLVPVIMFTAHLPVTLLGNLGYFESVFVFYFWLLGVPHAETLAMGLLLRLKMMCLGGAGYFVYLLYKYHRSQELSQLKEYARSGQADKL